MILAPQLLVRQCSIAEVPTRIAIDTGACTRVGSRRANKSRAAVAGLIKRGLEQLRRTINDER